MNYRVHKRENIYFALKVAGTIAVVLGLLAAVPPLFAGGSVTLAATLLTFGIYVLMIILFVLFQKVYLIAYMKGNGVCVSERQFPEVHAAYLRMAGELGLKKLPRLFILQQGGMLNAFAIRFSGKNYVAIYSDVFSILNSDMEVLAFVLGHELGHVKRAHMSKRFWTFPSAFIPFLDMAYSRSCEYTCDNIGSALVGGRAEKGLVLLAAGKELYEKVAIEEYLADARDNLSASVRFMGLFMSHPYLPRRIANVHAESMRGA